MNVDVKRQRIESKQEKAGCSVFTHLITHLSCWNAYTWVFCNYQGKCSCSIPLWLSDLVSVTSRQQWWEQATTAVVLDQRQAENCTQQSLQLLNILQINIILMFFCSKFHLKVRYIKTPGQPSCLLNFTNRSAV